MLNYRQRLRRGAWEMRRTLSLWSKYGTSSRPNLIQIWDGTFYREHPSTHAHDATTTNPPLFPNLNFNLPATPVEEVGQPVRKDEHWAVIAATEGTTFLEILRGSHICVPSNARTFPYLASDEISRKDHRLRTPSRAIQYVGFSPGKGQNLTGGIRGAYLSARYESHREETDWSLLNYLRGETELNPAEGSEGVHVDDSLLDKVISDLKLRKLLTMPVSNLSNGQTRRARIAKALLGKPELLLLDEPFMGLDPPTLVTLSPILRELAVRASPLLMLGLRPQDPIPDWITHLAILGEKHTVALAGFKDEVLFSLHRWIDIISHPPAHRQTQFWDRRWTNQMNEKYGPPLLGVGDSLNSGGISKYSEYDEIMQHRDYILKGYGGFKKEYLSRENQQLWQRARDTHMSQRELIDWHNLVALKPLRSSLETLKSIPPTKKKTLKSKEQHAPEDSNRGSPPLGEALIELQSVVVKYGDKTVLGFPPPQDGFSEPGLNLTIRRGTRLALLGPNGSGKTTLLSLLTSDHPHSYSLPIKFFGRSRLPSPGQPGLSLWDIQSRIGHSSPEIHAFFPKQLSIRKVLESAWAETYSARPKLSHERDLLVDAFLRWWEPELRQTPSKEDHGDLIRTGHDVALRRLFDSSYPTFLTEKSISLGQIRNAAGVRVPEGLEWAEDKDQHAFAVLPFAAQRLLLLLRAVIKKPDILILDEAFSGLSVPVRDKAMCWLRYGETKFLTGLTETGTVEQRNHRLDILRISQHVGFPVDEALTGRKRGDWAPPGQKREGVASRILEMDEEQLLELSDAADIDPQDSALDRSQFEGLTNDQALVVVSHVKEEIPETVNEYVRLPGEEEVAETGRGVELGSCDDGAIRTAEGWNAVWGFR